ncbi:hemerythrin domain-containing protein [Spirillospora sp. NPDC029432]|uniref:hemerythrin domain-containing protein n=1 Tax=Spirillospora sp. NPDC029432 TaxID=3154599 RepID=UPI003455AE7E
MSTVTANAPVQDVIGLLRHQHERIRELFDLVGRSAGTARTDALDRLVRLLAVHETAEEEIVHPVARRALPGGEEVVAERVAEEAAAWRALTELYAMDPDDPAFASRLDRLRGDVLAHARAEEAEEFSRLGDAFSDAQRRALAGAVKAAEAMAPPRPAPGTAPAGLPAGPPAAVLERARALIRDALA